ncbi:ligase-associated DNA damage response endonuclease PdeM [Amorphus sp. MBR-141]
MTVRPAHTTERSYRTVAIGGMSAALDPSGALYWADAATLIVADLHLEKGSSYARSRTFLPPYDSDVTLARLAEVVARFAPRRIVALGDSFHDSAAGDRLSAASRQTVRRLTDAADFIWISGNHDPQPPVDWGGTVAETMTIGGVTFRHEPSQGAVEAPEVAGHLHPVARVSGRGKSLRRRCFLGCGARMVLPAFGAYTGGLDIRDAAFRGLWPHRADVRAFLLGRDQVYAVGSVPAFA